MADRTTPRPVPRTRLRVPARVKLGVAVAVPLSIAAGVAAGSRLPSVLGSGDSLVAHHASAATPGRVGAGTAESVTAGPYFPVSGDDWDFGEADARFGASRAGHTHEGQDVFAKKGTPLIAVRTGIVIDEASADSAYSGGRGNFIAIYSELDDRTYVYFHMQQRSPLREGDPVTAGDIVGALGCTGACWGNHLHFEIRLGRGVERKPIDPLPFLRSWGPAPGAG